MPTSSVYPGLIILGIPDIWMLTKGEGVKIAVIDTGIDTDHPDLMNAIIDFKDFTNDGSVEDINGHGTHCAGIIAARENNVGFIGVAPKSELLIAKVFNEKGYTTDKWIAEAIDWAVSGEADLISMSLGGPQSSNLMFNSVHSALTRGVGIICAAGNEGSLYEKNIGYPGGYASVITIGSHDWNGNPSGFSSRGGELDFLGPGSEIWSTYKNGGYAKLSGTSMATPFVAGLAALIISKHRYTNSNDETPIENNEDLREHLMRMATHPGYYENQSGYGPLQPFRFFGRYI